jgi:hypothetical protein
MLLQVNFLLLGGLGVDTVTIDSDGVNNKLTTDLGAGDDTAHESVEPKG